MAKNICNFYIFAHEIDSMNVLQRKKGIWVQLLVENKKNWNFDFQYYCWHNIVKKFFNELTPCSFHECSSSHFDTAVVGVAGKHCETGCCSSFYLGGTGGGNYVAVGDGDVRRTRGVEGGRLAEKRKSQN